MNQSTIRRVAAGAVALTAVALTGCTITTDGFVDLDPGDRTSETRAISDVSAVRLATSGNMHLMVGDEPSLTITAGESVLERITSEVRGGTLEIDMRGRWSNPGRIDYELVVSELDTLVISGSGTISGGLGATDSVVVDIPGSGDVRLDPLDVSDVAVTIAGSGTVTLEGRTDSLAVSVPGSGDFTGADLSSRTAVVSISGSGQARVNVQQTLDASIAGSGRITYLGDPRVTSNITGSGHVGRA